MLAHGKDVNVLNDDHFVVALVKDGIIEDVYFFFSIRNKLGESLAVTINVLLVALGKVHECLGVAVGRLEQSRSLWVLANALEQGLDRPRHLFQSLLTLLAALILALECAGT